MRNKLILPLGIAVAGVLLAVAIPNYIKARVVASKNSCLENLKKIEEAKGRWAADNKVTNRDTEPTDAELFSNTKYFAQPPTCFLEGTYSIGKLSEQPRCSRPEHSL